jgi:RNA polymerase sigma factor (sigma-70 family)
LSGTPRTASARLLHLARAAGEPAADADLVARFVRTRDEGAFAALVERHGPMVLGVCRRVLGDPHAAEDAFTAAFLALARNAARVRDPRAVAAWLYGAAVRVALKARRSAARSGPVERPAPARPAGDPLAEITGRELAAAIDEELARLPDRFRAPVVLCCLDGLSQADAARRLGWSAGSVRGRLERGRERLRQRLARRGIALPTALALLAATDGTALTPPGLLDRTVRLATTGPAPPALADLARAAVGAGTVSKLAAVAALAVAAGLVGALGRGQPPKPTPPVTPAPSAAAKAARVDPFGDPLPADAVARLGTVRFNHGDGLRVVRYLPDGNSLVSVGNGWARVWDVETGAEIRQFPVAHTSWKDEAVVSPDGKTLIHLQQDRRTDLLGAYDLATGKAVWTRSLPAGGGPAYPWLRNALSPDGRLALVNAVRARRVFDTATGKDLCQIGPVREDMRDGAFVNLDEEAVAFASPDRVVTRVKGGPIEVWDARTGRLIRAFTPDGPAGVLVPSADGKFVATIEGEFTLQKDRLDPDVARVWDLTTGKLVQRFVARPKSLYRSVAFAPDGR